MDKLAESSSDSDSNSSTSWVFVDDNSVSYQKATNTFHLDCSREPIQELTEQDLMSTGSDIESDTDGISVISESEIPPDDLCSSVTSSSSSSSSFTGLKQDNETKNIDNYKVEAKADLALAPKQNEKLPTLFKPQHMLGIGFVLTALFLASYTWFTTKVNLKNVDGFSGIANEQLSDVDILIDDLNRFNDGKNDLDEELEEIVDLTMSCTYGYKPKNSVKEVEIKKCVKKYYKTKRICLKGNDGTTNEKVSEWKIMPNKIVDSEMRNEYEANTKPVRICTGSYGSYKNAKEIRKMDRDENGNYKKSKKDGTACNTQTEDHSSNKYEKKGKVKKLEKQYNKETISKDQLKYNKKKYESQEKVFISKKQRDTRQKNFEYSSKNAIPLKQIHKHKKDKKHHEYDYKHKMKHFFNKKEYEFKYHNRNSDKANFKIINIDENTKNKSHKYKENIGNKSEKQEAKDPKLKYKKNKENIKDDRTFTMQQSNNTNGEWYINLHKARNKIRKEEHVSDWVFDRAHIRNKKRNKAQWYFKWMNIREQLRYKQSYRPYSS